VRNDKRDIKRSIEDQKRLGFLRQQEINRTEVNRRAREQELEEERLQKAAIPQFQRDKATKEKINATRHRKRLETTTKYISSLSSNMDEYIKRF
jgi:L-fucose isomerase-like protein